MLGERQVAAPLMAQRAAHGALRLAHRRFQPGEGVGIQLAGLRPGGKPQRPSHCQFGHETLVLAFALFAPAASCPGQHRAVRRQRGRQLAPCGHTSTVGQRFSRLVLRDDQEERRRTSSWALVGRTPVLGQGAVASTSTSACRCAGPGVASGPPRPGPGRKPVASPSPRRHPAAASPVMLDLTRAMARVRMAGEIRQDIGRGRAGLRLRPGEG